MAKLGDDLLSLDTLFCRRNRACMIQHGIGSPDCNDRSAKQHYDCGNKTCLCRWPRLEMSTGNSN